MRATEGTLSWYIEANADNVRNAHFQGWLQGLRNAVAIAESVSVRTHDEAVDQAIDTARMAIVDAINRSIDPHKSMTGFFASLTPEQQERALVYTGPETTGEVA